MIATNGTPKNLLSQYLQIPNGISEEMLMHLQLEECKSKSTRVILVRHGQSTYNTLGLYQGSIDESVLTTVGRREARQTGALFKGLKFDAIYSSSLKRARDTTEEILGAIAPEMDSSKLHFTSQLRETDLPNWHGLSFQYVRENFPEQYHTWKNCPHKFCMQVDEVKGITNLVPDPSDFYPAVDLYKRIRLFWHTILPLHLGQTLLIVAHGGTNRALISTALGVKSDRYHCIQQSNCGISILDFPDGSLDSGRLLAMNITSDQGDRMVPQLQEGSGGLRLFIVPSDTLNVGKMAKLGNLLRDTTIDFSLTEHIKNAQVITEQILQYHRQTVQLEVLQQDFSQVWQKAIETRGLMAKPAIAGGVAPSRNIPTHQSLVTGLVVADKNVIKSLIAQVLRMNVTATKRLCLQPGTISSIHYPSSQLPPVLQTMNS